jgi:hypothetical protein
MTRNITLAVFVAALLGGAPAVAQEGEKAPAKEKTVFDFNDSKVGETPKGWTVAETKSDGTPAKWRVETIKDDDARKNAVKVETKNKEAVFNLLLSEKSHPADLTLNVKIKAGTGEDDRGGGLLWRAVDADNYYIARWNPLEKNIRLYKVEAGKRTTLKSAESDADGKTWHDLKIVHAGNKISVHFDGKEVLSAEDDAFKAAGKVGFWTKADASTWFDDLEIEATK